MARYTYSIWPVVSFLHLFKRFDGVRVVIAMINSMVANNSCLRSHLGRISIVKNPVCVCALDYETIYHVLWGCKRFDAGRPQLWMDLKATDIE
jgi:hypothetical protein